MVPHFTNWMGWLNRKELHNMHFPGVYALAISKKDLSDRSFSWIPEIVYIGMTNSKGGLTSRLRQFDNTIRGKVGHGGAHRFHFKHPEYEKLTKSLYVAVSIFPCDVTSESPIDLRVMGDVAKYEYECFAIFSKKFGVLPEFNDKKLSPKK
ncbi:MAG: hypothetical protein ABIK15_05470 [Pseudomonadota bacterium]